MRRGPYPTFAVTAAVAGCLALTHSVAVLRGQDPAQPPKYRPARTGARMRPGPRISPFEASPAAREGPHAYSLSTAFERPLDPRLHRMPEPVSGDTTSRALPAPDSRNDRPLITLKHDPLVLRGGKPAQIQLLLSRPSATDTRVELVSDSTVLSLPRSIIIPAGRVLGGIRVTPSASGGKVGIRASTVDGDGRKITAQTVLSIQAN